MSELYTISITGIFVSEHGDPENWFSADTLRGRFISQLIDMKVHTQLFATHEDGKIAFTLMPISQLDTPQAKIPDPHGLISDALNDAQGFYEMFEGWDGVKEREERLQQAWRSLDSGDATEIEESPAIVEIPQYADIDGNPYDLNLWPHGRKCPFTGCDIDEDGSNSCPDDCEHYRECGCGDDEDNPKVFMCPECGSSFEQHHHAQKYCSADCRIARNKRAANISKKEVKS